MASIYDFVMWTYYAAHLRCPPDPARYVLVQPGWLPEAGLVLDFGGGDGRWTFPLAEARGARVVVADIDAAALRRVPRHPLVSTTLLSGPSLPFPNEAFDLVFVNRVLHHVEGLPPAFGELRRVVRPGGRIVCVEFHPRCAVTRIYRVFSRFRRHPCTFYTPEALAGLCGIPPFCSEYGMLDGFQYLVSAHRPSLGSNQIANLRGAKPPERMPIKPSGANGRPVGPAARGTERPSRPTAQGTRCTSGWGPTGPEVMYERLACGPRAWRSGSAFRSSPWWERVPRNLPRRRGSNLVAAAGGPRVRWPGGHYATGCESPAVLQDRGGRRRGGRRRQPSRRLRRGPAARWGC